jgi:dolichol-phosphate mannosyltransferase
MGRDIDVSIILPCYNEKENLEVLLPEIIGKFNAKGIDFEILIVDDSSPDGTPEFIEYFGSNDPRVKLVLREKKEGIGAALRHGYDVAIGEIILSSDADQSFKVDDMLRLVDKIGEGFDLVVGSRHSQSSSYERKRISTKIKGLVSSFGNSTISFISGLGIRDFSANFRAIKKEVWESISIKEKTNSILLEMIMKCHYGGHKVTEIPVSFSERIYGESKLNLAVEAPKFLFKFIQFTIRFRVFRRGLK